MVVKYQKTEGYLKIIYIYIYIFTLYVLHCSTVVQLGSYLGQERKTRRKIELVYTFGPFKIAA